MTDTSGGINVQLPDGTTLNVATSDEKRAAQVAKLYMQKNQRAAIAPGSEEDRNRAALSGVGSGVTGLAGLPGLGRDVGTWAGKKIGYGIGHYIQGLSDEEIQRRQDAMTERLAPLTAITPDPGEVSSMAETGLKQAGVDPLTAQVAAGSYEPGTTAGKLVKAGVAGATGGGITAPLRNLASGSAVRALSAVTPAVEGGVAGLASEGAGQAADKTFGEGSTASTAARIAGGLAVIPAKAAVTTVALGQESQLGRMLNQQLKKASPQEIQAAETLKQDMAARGQEITTGEALKQATDGRIDITNLERQATGRPASAAVMNDAYARRHTEAQQQMAEQVQQVQGPGAGLDPSQAGRRFAQAAEDVADAPRKAANTALEPYWKRAAPVQLAMPDVLRVLQRNPTLGPEAFDFIQNHPTQYALDPAAASTAVDPLSVGYWGQMYRHAQEQAADATLSNTQRAGWSNLAQDLRPMLAKASPDWKIANDATRHVYETVTRPVRESMTGAVAELAPDSRTAVGPVGPDVVTRKVESQIAPGAGTTMARGGAQQASDLVTRVAGRDPAAAGKVVGDVLANQFAGQGPMTGPNAQFTPAKIANKMQSDPEQMDRLRAAVAPLHPQAAQGLNNLLDWFRAMGWRQPTGSVTSFNDAYQNDAQRRLISMGMVKPLAHVQEYFNSWRGDRVYQLLAQETWKPDGVNRLAELAKISKDSPTFLRRALSIVGPIAQRAQRLEQKDQQSQPQPYDQPGSGP